MTRPAPRPMILFFLIRSLEPGGAERQLVALANGLAARGHQVHVAVFYGGGALEADLDGPLLHDLRKTGRWDAPGFLLRLVRLMRQLQPDLVHGYLGTANLLLALTKPFLRSVPVFWGVRASDMDLSHYSALHRWHWKLEAALSSIPARIIYNAEAGRVHAEGCGFSAPGGVVVPNGIDTDRFQPDDDAGQRVRGEWGVTSDQILIGLPARLDPMKDQRTFLQAAKRLSQRDPSFRFVCIGDGPLRQELKAYARDMELDASVIWAGQRSDMVDVYSALDICCLSSAFGEGFPNVIGEAMSCGVPCVATDVGDSARIIGSLGTVAPAKNVPALADAIMDLRTRLHHERDALAAACRQHMVSEYGLDAMVERTEALFRSPLQR